MKYNEHYDNERQARALLTMIAEPADNQLSHLIKMFDPQLALDIVFASREDDQLHGLRVQLNTKLPDFHMGEYLEQQEAKGIRFVTIDDDEYPALLRGIPEGAPFGLWMRGQEYPDAESVAIVGARAATSYGEQVAHTLANDLAQAGSPIVSGMAYGIDGAAHRVTLAAGKPTVAYLAGGLDRPYPLGHTDLFDRIIEGGTVVSERAEGSATRWRFLARNRLIAGSTVGTVVVEAGIRSGSISTANQAKQYGRTLMAVPGPVTSAASTGTNALIRSGEAIAVTSAHDVMQTLKERAL